MRLSTTYRCSVTHELLHPCTAGSTVTLYVLCWLVAVSFQEMVAIREFKSSVLLILSSKCKF